MLYHESPSLGITLSIVACARSRSESTPWSVRELWSRQIISAVSDVHGKALVAGGNFFLCIIGVRVDGSAVLTDFRMSNRQLLNRKDHMAPEL